MKNTHCLVVVALILFGLTACQTQPTPAGEATASPVSQSLEFFEGVAGKWISIEPPAGWDAKLTGTTETPLIVVTDDWDKYLNKALDAQAIGIIIVPLSDKGSAEQVLAISVERLKSQVAEPIGEVLLEQSEGQAYAWGEYQGTSFQDGSPLHYFLAVIATEQRTALVFTSVPNGRQETVRPDYQTVVKAITLH